MDNDEEHHEVKIKMQMKDDKKQTLPKIMFLSP